MEAAGLAVGVIAFVGLFTDCLNTFSIICTAGQAGRDLDILETKLDIEKNTLLTWANRVRLLREDSDPRLVEHATQQAVHQALRQLRSLLVDATTIENRYGLGPISYDMKTTGDRFTPSDAISRRRQFHFEKSLEDLRGKVEKLKISPLNRARWVVKDKNSFDSLVTDISYFVDRLHRLVPDTPAGTTTRIMMEEDFSENLRAHKLMLVCDASPSRADIANTAIKSLDTKCQSRIYNLLWYPEMQTREQKISPAHKATFAWALQQQPEGSDWDDLSCWLRSKSGIYWVRGKAGSGKSTLMKYIWFHSETKKLVSEWAGRSPHLMANFYFWRIGTSNQSSLEGLFRGIVCQILLYRPSVTQALFPTLWDQAFGKDDEAPLKIPTLEELKALPLRISQVGELKDTKVCLFIDGLDEFAGDYRDGVEFVQALATRPETKVVLSSRPEPILVDTFKGMANLRLEDLTKRDIRNYVADNLGQHDYVQSLIEMGTISESEELISDIAQKACGVFLWVVLACRSLLDGFVSFDTMAELRKRINDLPPELEELFKVMLMKVDPRYRAQGAKILKLCYLNSASPWSYPVPTIGLALLDEFDMDPARMPPIQRLSVP